MSVRYEIDGPVVVVAVDRPEVANAIDRPTADALADAFRRFELTSLSVAVLPAPTASSAAARTSRRCAGDPDTGHAGRGRWRRPSRADSEVLGKPVIAAVEGHAVAGGLKLAAWCDLRVAAEDAVFGVFCRR